MPIKSSSVAPCLLAPFAKSEFKTLSAHIPPHNARSSGVWNSHVPAEHTIRLGSYPASRAHALKLDAPPRVRLPAVCARDALVQARPRGEARALGEPRERAPVALAHGNDAARTRHAAQLAEHAHGVAAVLQHLVRVRDVERGVRERERVRVAGGEGDVVRTARGGVALCARDSLRALLEPRGVPLRHVGCREVEGDGARPAADVEDAEV